MVHLVTKSHMVLKHLDIISAMKDQVQLEMTITTLDEAHRRKIEGCAPSVAKRLKVIKEFALAGVFVRAMCMPLIGIRQDAEGLIGTLMHSDRARGCETAPCAGGGRDGPGYQG